MASLPPERINIKRKRDEDAVDILYIEGRKRQLAEQRFFFRRLEIPGPNSVPVIKVDQPATGNATTYRSSTKGSSKLRAKNDTSRETSSSLAPKQARRFHLDKHLSVLGPKHNKNVRKRSKSPSKTPVAVFEERSTGSSPRKSTVRQRRNHSAKSFADLGESQESLKNPVEAVKQRIRPRASDTELRWRAETWVKKEDKGKESPSKVKKGGATAFGADELLLARELQAFALEQTADDPELDTRQDSHEGAHLARSRTTNDRSTTNAAKLPLKFQPNPSAARTKAQHREQHSRARSDGPHHNGHDDLIHLDGDGDQMIVDQDSDEDYVLETYVRVPYHDQKSRQQVSNRNVSVPGPLSTNSRNAKQHYVPMDEASLKAMDGGATIGVLVIEDGEDEVLWATYADHSVEDGSDAEGWGSEDEDENAEDHYGNDYPEDEVASDDEFDKGAYHYRQADSDEEQFGIGQNDDGSDSDGDADRRVTTQRPVWSLDGVTGSIRPPEALSAGSAGSGQAQGLHRH